MRGLDFLVKASVTCADCCVPKFSITQRGATSYTNFHCSLLRQREQFLICEKWKVTLRIVVMTFSIMPWLVSYLFLDYSCNHSTCSCIPGFSLSLITAALFSFLYQICFTFSYVFIRSCCSHGEKHAKRVFSLSASVYLWWTSWSVSDSRETLTQMTFTGST